MPAIGATPVLQRRRDVSACVPSLRYLELPLLSTFFKGYKQPAHSLILLPPKSGANCKWPQGKQEHKQLLWWRSLIVLAVLKKTTHLYARDSKKQIPVLSLFSPHSDMKHHVNPTNNRSETSQHGLVPQALASLLHCPSTALLLGIPNATLEHEFLFACSTRDFLTLPVFWVLKYSLFITLLSDYITYKMLHMEIVLPNFCIKHDIPATHSSIEFLKRKHIIILKLETWRQKPWLTYNMQPAHAFFCFTMVIYEF